MRSRSTGLLIGLLLAAAPRILAAGDAWKPTLASFDGEVKVKTPGDADFRDARKGEPLPEGTVIKTAARSEARVSVDAGSLLELEANTELTLSNERKNESFFSLALGTMLAKFKALTKDQAFQVRASNSVAAIRGTEFAVWGDPHESKVGVFDEGRVEVAQPDGKGAIALGPGQETDVAPESAPSAPHKLVLFKGLRKRLKELRRLAAEQDKDERRDQERQERRERREEPRGR